MNGTPPPSAPPASQASSLYHTPTIVVWMWALFFSLNSLSLAVLAGFTNIDWLKLTTQARILLCVAIFANWSNTMGAFISKVVARGGASKAIIPNGSGDTAMLYRPQPPVLPPTQPKTG